MPTYLGMFFEGSLPPAERETYYRAYSDPADRTAGYEYYRAIAVDVREVVAPDSAHFIPEENPRFLIDCARLFFSDTPTAPRLHDPTSPGARGDAGKPRGRRADGVPLGAVAARAAGPSRYGDISGLSGH
ncbi:MAG TPA: hypothetical protein VE645_11225 [Pseudonocardiaceae bacterium]|nr:hypothetical protein [Pseudonocardiaceae bacterium]